MKTQLILGRLLGLVVYYAAVVSSTNADAVCRVHDIQSMDPPASLKGPCALPSTALAMPPQGPRRILGESADNDRAARHKCPVRMSTSEAMLTALKQANFDCTESISGKLSPLASRKVIRALMKIGTKSVHSWTRRNAIRVMGDFCWTGSNCQTPFGAGCQLDKACKLLLKDEKASFEHFLYERVQHETHENPLDDALWLVSSYFPTMRGLKSKYLQISKGTHAPLTKTRAKLLWNGVVSRQSFLSDDDIANLLHGLKSHDESTLGQFYTTSQYVLGVCDREQKQAILAQLKKNHVNSTSFGIQTRASLASAIDRFDNSDQHVKKLQAKVEAQLLPNNVSDGKHVTVFSSLPMAQIKCWLALVQREWSVFFDFLGPPFNQALSDRSSHDHISIFVFAEMSQYQQYMQSFVGFAANAGGLYVAAKQTLYTYQRTSVTSYITVEELILHEFGHYLQRRYILPGAFGDDAGSHSKAKGWFDEGLADFWGGLNFNGKGCYSMPLRINYMERICRSHDYKRWQLSKLLSRQAGYESNGVFEYKHAYTFVYFLATEHFDVFKKILLALKHDQYDLNKWESITGISINETNKIWHGALDKWCAQPEHTVSQPVFKCAKDHVESDGCTVIGHGFRKDHEMYSDLGESQEVSRTAHVSTSPTEILKRWIQKDQHDKEQDERNVHIGTNLEDLLGPTIHHVSQTIHDLAGNDDLLKFF